MLLGELAGKMPDGPTCTLISLANHPHLKPAQPQISSHVVGIRLASIRTIDLPGRVQERSEFYEVAVVVMAVDWRWHHDLCLSRGRQGQWGRQDERSQQHRTAFCEHGLPPSGSRGAVTSGTLAGWKLALGMDTRREESVALRFREKNSA